MRFYFVTDYARRFSPSTDLNSFQDFNQQCPVLKDSFFDNCKMPILNRTPNRSNILQSRESKLKLYFAQQLGKSMKFHFLFIYFWASSQSSIICKLQTWKIVPSFNLGQWIIFKYTHHLFSPPKSRRLAESQNVCSERPGWWFSYGSWFSVKFFPHKKKVVALFYFSLSTVFTRPLQKKVFSTAPNKTEQLNRFKNPTWFLPIAKITCQFEEHGFFRGSIDQTGEVEKQKETGKEKGGGGYTIRNHRNIPSPGLGAFF